MPTKEGYLKKKEYYCKYAREYRLKNKYHLASNLLLKCIPSTIICFAFIT